MTSIQARRGPIKIDPMFPIPVGVDELVYADNDEVDGLAALALDELYGSDNDGDTDGDGIPVPDILGIISQKMRRTKAGNQVIDVLFDVEDIEGAVKYELRVVKL